jgi:hypothetical protein
LTTPQRRGRSNVRVRVVLGVALVLVVGALVVEMSGRTQRISDTDHFNPVGFVGVVGGGQELCQSAMLLPEDVRAMRVLVGTYGSRVPAMAMRFLVDGRQVARGQIPAGGIQGNVTLPVSYPHGPSVAGSLCVHVAHSPTKTVFAGDVFTPGPVSEQVNGKPQAGRIAVTFLRGPHESWWHLLPTLSRRFGLGKSPFFGDWTLPVAALLLLGVWVGAVRLLARELI